MHKGLLKSAVFWGLNLAALSGIAAEQPPTCQSEQHRQFDFWLGDWVVHTSEGRLAGHNRIELKHNGCVLHEQYRTPGSYNGQSLNIYDAGRGVWHQTWTDSSGTLLLLEGGLQDGKMVMSGQTTGKDGAVSQHRISWTPNKDGSIRQHWQMRSQESDEWSDAFDGIYTRP